MDHLLATLERHNEDYRAGNPTISDHEYDGMLATLANMAPSHPFLKRVEPEGDFGAGKIRHDVPMLSTDKAYTADEVDKWVTRVLNAAATLGIHSSFVDFKATAKLDGIAAKYRGGKLATRGTGEVGNDITSAFDKGVVPLGPVGDSVGEIVMLSSYFDEHMSEVAAYPRNVVAGIVSANSDSVASILVQGALDSNSVRYVPFCSLPDWTGDGAFLRENLSDICEDLLTRSPYPTDGVVIECTHEKVKAHMGCTGHHHLWQIAKKQRGESAHCKVLGVTWQVGRTGRVTPVINIEPTFISGATISNVTGHHAGNIYDKGIGVGAVIEVVRSGEVIPWLARVVTSVEAEIPNSCPCCEAALYKSGDFLECPNNIDCSAQTIEVVLHWFKVLGNADGFGPSTVCKLSAAGFDSVEKIYTKLTVDGAELSGFGPKEATNLVKQLNRSMSERIDDWRLLAAFGIPNLGRGDSKRLLKHVSIFKLGQLTHADIMAIDGFGKLTADAIFEDLALRIDTLNLLLSLGFNLEITGSAVAKESPITGKHIVFTGGMVLGKRDDMKAHAESLGAIPQGSINKKTQILVAGAKASQAKVEKAGALGAVVYNEAEYLKLIEE